MTAFDAVDDLSHADVYRRAGERQGCRPVDLMQPHDQVQHRVDGLIHGFIEILIEAERVILATGTRPCNHLYQKAKSLGYEIHRIGDCLEARNAKAAIYEGAVLGRSI